MPKCEACGVEMNSGKSCKHNIAGRVKWGAEAMQRFNPAASLFCRDCGVMKGGFHHINCSQEECGTCGGQTISCLCDDKGGLN